MYRLYSTVKEACENFGRFKFDGVYADFTKECAEAESVTAHPYVKYQKARILQYIDNSNILDTKHKDDIIKGFSDAVYAIKTIELYSGIQQTKSYASLLWLFGQYLSDVHDLQSAIRYLEESKDSFENQKNTDQEYYQCITKLGNVYLDYYLADRAARIMYLRRARTIDKLLSANWSELGKARVYAGQLHTHLQSYGQY